MWVAADEVGAAVSLPPKLPKRVRIREKYNPKPSEQERAFHDWLMDTFPCACGCGGQSTVVHHPLEEHPDQRWRRDHEFVVPMNGFCHMRLHRRGHEREAPYAGFAGKAWGYRARGLDAGYLRKAA